MIQLINKVFLHSIFNFISAAQNAQLSTRLFPCLALDKTFTIGTVTAMSSEIIIRSAVPEDLPVLLTFEQGIIRAERPYDHTLKPDPISYYDVGALISDDNAEVAVAELNGKLIGSGYARRKSSRHYLNPGEHAFIGFLYVDPAHRGQGVNKHVLNHLFDWARANGLPEIHLTVYPGNESAIKAYEKAGFDPYLLEMRLNLDE